MHWGQPKFSLELLNILFLHHGTKWRTLIPNLASPRKNKMFPACPCLKTGNDVSLYSHCIYSALLNLQHTLVSIMEKLAWNTLQLPKPISTICSFPSLVWGPYIFPLCSLLQDCPCAHPAEEPKHPSRRHIFWHKPRILFVLAILEDNHYNSHLKQNILLE